MENNATGDVNNRLAFLKNLQLVTNKIHATSNTDEILLELSQDICDLFNSDRLTIYLLSEALHGTLILSLTPFRKVIKDYFALCDSYFKAIPNQPSGRIEALDMGRRGLHDEGANILIERLKGKIEVDFDTARRLFTLICVLHLKG